MKKLYTVILFAFVCAMANAQKQFSDAIGGIYDDIGYSIINSNNEGYVVSGYSQSGYLYVVKLDTLGSIKWTKQITGTRSIGYSIIQTVDKGYAVAGSVAGTLNWKDVLLIKFDSTGNVQWSKAFGGSSSTSGSEDDGYSLIQSSDGGYVIAGYTMNFGFNAWNGYVVKFDGSGNLLWTYVIGATANQYEEHSLVQTTDGGYLVVGIGGSHCHVLKLDNSGILQWTKTIGGTGSDGGKSIIHTSDGGYAIAGYTESFGSGNNDVYVIKLDSNYSLQWTRTVGGAGNDEANAIIQTKDGGYAITGDTYSFGAGSNDVYLIKLDSSGVLQWTKTMGGTGSDCGNSLVQTKNGGYIITGYTSSFGNGAKDVYVLNVDSIGYSCATTGTGGNVGSGGSTGSSGVSSTGGYFIASSVTAVPFGTIKTQCITCDTPLVLNVGPNVSICQNGSTTISASASAAPAPYTYSWTPTTGLSNPNISNPVASPTLTTTYKVIATSSAGCTSTDSITVTVNTHSICISGNETVCSGQTVVLSTTGIGLTGYNWMPSGQSTSSITESPTVNTTYKVVGTFSNGCFDSAFTTVFVNACYPDRFCMAISNSGVCSYQNPIYGEDIIQTNDGGYAVAGMIGNYDADDVYFAKLNSDGILQWSETIGGTSGDEAHSVIQTTDGGYALAGYTFSYGAGGQDMYVIKTDATGNLQWTKTIGGTGYDAGYSIIQTTDGGYALTGVTNLSVGGDELYIVKLDNSGNLQWTRTVGTTLSYSEQGYSIIQTMDGGYAVTGFTTSGYGGYKDVYVVKVDNGGSLQWVKSFGASYDDYGKSIVQTSDGGYVIGGVYNSNTFHDNVFLLKLDANGTMQWYKVTGVNYAGFAYSANDLITTSDGGFAITGMKDSVSYDNIYFAKFSSVGNLQWTKVVGGTNYDVGNALVQTTDGGYAAIGSDFSIVKLDASNNSCCNFGTGGVVLSQVVNSASVGVVNSGGSLGTGGSILSLNVGVPSSRCSAISTPLSTEELDMGENGIILFPNPTSGKFTIQNEKGIILKMEAYNVFGQKIYHSTTQQLNNSTIDLSEAPNGIYFLQLKTEQGIATKKLIIQK